MVQLIAGLWWAIAVAIVWALLLGWGFGAWLYRVHAPRMPQIPAGEMRATTYFAGAIGAASEMTLLAERDKTRDQLSPLAMRVVKYVQRRLEEDGYDFELNLDETGGVAYAEVHFKTLTKKK